MLDYLQKNNMLENTIIVYSSDQGFFLGEHGLFDKRWMYEESFRMPFLISWKGKIKPGSRYKQMIQNIDYAPTFIAAGGQKVPAQMQGKSLLPTLANNAPKWRKSVYYHYYERRTEHNAPRHEGVRTDHYKLMHFYDHKDYDLFDLEKDPNEMKDVSKDPVYADILKKMK